MSFAFTLNISEPTMSKYPFIALELNNPRGAPAQASLSLLHGDYLATSHDPTPKPPHSLACSCSSPSCLPALPLLLPLPLPLPHLGAGFSASVLRRRASLSRFQVNSRGGVPGAVAKTTGPLPT